VVELAPADTPGKGTVILREARARGLAGCLFAGDDQADLAGFHALDQLRADGLAVVKVAVRSEETPADLVEAADVVVERPDGLLELLGRL
jgi:trehalose-6-phosphatase